MNFTYVIVAPGIAEHSTTTPPLSVPYSMGMPAPAPVPAVNAWEKPISITAAAAVPVTSVGPNGQVKFDPKSDQHDSGIDISEPQNSNSSSTRSSPSAENKLRGTDLIEMAEKMDETNRAGGDMTVLSMKSDVQFDVPKQQRQPKTPRDKEMKVEEDNSRVVKKPNIKQEKQMSNETNQNVMAGAKTVTGMEPIQLPASFKGFNFAKGEDSSDIKLDFTFDAELAKLTEEKAETKEVTEQMNQPISMPNPTSRVTTLQSPTSPATEDLNLKIASVKNVWETMPIMPTVFEHSMSSVSSGAASVSVSASDADAVPTSQHFSASFSAAAETAGQDLSQPAAPASGQEVTVSVEPVSRKQEMNATAEPFVASLSHGQSAGLSYMDSVVTTAASHLKTMVSEQSNVCKVTLQLCTCPVSTFFVRMLPLFPHSGKSVKCHDYSLWPGKTAAAAEHGELEQCRIQPVSTAPANHGTGQHQPDPRNDGQYSGYCEHGELDRHPESTGSAARRHHRTSVAVSSLPNHRRVATHDPGNQGEWWSIVLITWSISVRTLPHDVFPVLAVRQC